MFLPCPNCGFLVSVIAGREATQRCPRCRSGLVDEATAEAMRDAPATSDPSGALVATGEARVGANVDQRDATPTATIAAVERAGHVAADPHPENAPGDAAVDAVDAREIRQRTPHGDSPATDAPDEPSEPSDERAEAADAIHAKQEMHAVQASEQPAASEGGVTEHAFDPADASNVLPAEIHESAADEVPQREAPFGDRAETDSPPSPAQSPPRFLHRRNAARLPPGRAWIAPSAVAALALLLALQLLLSQRAELAASARWRPWVVATCRVFGCDVPHWREPATLVMTGRNVRPDPRQPGVLQVTATVRNDARWPQPLPVVVLNLSDADGRVLAARDTLPTDYSPRPTALIAPGDSVDIAFGVREPAARVDAFDFALR